MKAFISITLKRAVIALAIAAVVLSVSFMQNEIVQGKNGAFHALTSTPLAGAKIFLTKASGNSAAQTTLSTTSGNDGKFTFPSVTADSRGSGMVTYTLTVLPLVTYTVTDSKSTGPKATPYLAPVSVSVTLNQLRGLTAGGTIANNGPIGPFNFMTNDSLRIGVAMGGVISGTVTKQ